MVLQNEDNFNIICVKIDCNIHVTSVVKNTIIKKNLIIMFLSNNIEIISYVYNGNKVNIYIDHIVYWFENALKKGYVLNKLLFLKSVPRIIWNMTPQEE